MAVVTDRTLSPQVQAALAEARRIIDQSWIEVGVSPEQLAREDTMADVFEILLHEGKTEEQASDYLEATSWEEIQRKRHGFFDNLEKR